MEPPGNIPNPEVKCGCADGTLNTQGRVSSCHDYCMDFVEFIIGDPEVKCGCADDTLNKQGKVRIRILAHDFAQSKNKCRHFFFPSLVVIGSCHDYCVDFSLENRAHLL